VLGLIFVYWDHIYAMVIKPRHNMDTIGANVVKKRCVFFNLCQYGMKVSEGVKRKNNRKETS